MDRKSMLLTISLILFILTIVFIYFGCACSSDKTSIERFEVESTDEIDQSDLSSKEKELFQDLISNKLSTEQISELVKGGVLTHNMVEKFLNKLDKNLYKADEEEDDEE